MSRGDSWNTPHEIAALVRRFWPWGLDLDPCSNPGSVMGGRVRVFAPLEVEGAPTAEELVEPLGLSLGLPDLEAGVIRDGLAFDWSSASGSPPVCAYVNPPFSAPTPWAERCRRYALEGSVESLLMVPVQTSSAWWRANLWPAPAICFLHKRIAFLDDGVPVKGNPRDSALVYHGAEVWRFRQIFGTVGEVRTP